jgi:hypothetical protein
MIYVSNLPFGCLYFFNIEHMFGPHYVESSNVSKQKDYNSFPRVEPKEIPNTPNCNIFLSAYLIPN